MSHSAGISLFQHVITHYLVPKESVYWKITKSHENIPSVTFDKLLWKRFRYLFFYLLPEGGDTVAGGPAYDEAPLGVVGSFADLVQTVCHPHLTNSNLGLSFKVSRWPAGREKRSGWIPDYDTEIIT